MKEEKNCNRTPQVDFDSSLWGSLGPLVGTDSSLYFLSYGTFYYAFWQFIETRNMIDLVFHRILMSIDQ